MPNKKSGEKLTRIPVGVSPGQAEILKRLVASGIYGTTEGDVIRYFLVKGIEHLADTKVLPIKIPK